MDLTSKRPKVEVKPYNVITYSNIDMFLTCPMKYYFRNILKIVPYKIEEPLFVGGVFHDAIEFYYKNSKSIYDTDVLNGTFDFITKECQKVDDYHSSNHDVMIQGMVGGYVMYFKDSPYEIIENEIQFDIPINDDDNYHRCGKTDAIMRHRQTGNLYLGEWKTATRISDYVNTIKVNNQGNNYLWAFEEKLGEKLHGVIFRIAKKSQLRLKKDESIVDFRNRVFEDYTKRQTENFHEEVVYLDSIDLKRWKHEVFQIKDQIKTITDANGWYRNTGSCYKWSKLCGYYSACKCTNKVDLDSAIEVDYIHEEPGTELFAIK